jgi:ribosomal protein S18 acetylase RimI-like enzyme
LSWLWEAIIHFCLLFGEVYTTPTLKGVACWTAPGQANLNGWQMLRSGFALPRAIMRYRPATRERFLTVLAVMERVRHEVMPKNNYWYLWALGVEPDYQGQGIGGRLLQPVLEKANAAGLACYLETETERNVTLYRKHGFYVAREETIAWLDQKIWMLRRESI